MKNIQKKEKNALKFIAEAKKRLFPHIFYGGVVGVIPIVDWVVQKFVIKKEALKQVGEIFGIDMKFIEEENAKKEIKKEKDNYLNYINEIDGEKELEESSDK